jgi:CBS domain-containing protein
VGGSMSAPIISLHNSKTVKDAAKLMAEHNIGALVIMNRKHVLKGLLTAKHLTHKFLTNPNLPPDEAMVEDYANTNPLILPQEYPLVETLAEMLRTGEDYALIAKKNKPVGIISKSDIIELLSVGSDIFSATVSRTNNLEELKEIVATLPRILENMMNNTSIFREILPSLTSTHLIIQKRVYELTKVKYRKEQNFELLPGRFCIISTGNLARREMTLQLLQNNAMLLSDKLSDSDVEHYAGFAKMYSEMLHKTGYSFHPDGVCLNNPDMIKKLNDWRTFISESIHHSNESNIPITRLLFDCEKLEGDETLLWDYKDAINETIKEKALFFGRLINYQAKAKIPISQFGSFIPNSDGTIDLEKCALNFLTYTTQAFSLNVDLYDVNTIRRINHLGRKKALPEELVREAVIAYEAIVDVILHEQLVQYNHGEEISCSIYPDKLSMHSQEQLKRAFIIVARFIGEGLATF